MHVRGQIRSAATADLVTVAGLDADHVFFDSDEMLQQVDLPCACVWLGDEEIEHETLGGSTGAILGRRVLMHVDLLHRARADALVAAEEIAALVETKIATSTGLLALCRSWFLQGIEITRDAEGSLPTVRLRMQWLITYATNERTPTVAIP